MPKGEKNRKLTDEQREEVIRLYTTKLPDGTWMGTTSIARIYHISEPSIAHLLKKSGVPMRNSAEAHAGKTCKPIKNLPQGDPPLCKCGCGQSVEWDRRANRWEVYHPGHYRKDAPYKHHAWLASEYIDKSRTLVEIAAECGVNISTIANYMRKFDIRTRPQAQTLNLRGTSRPGAQNGSWSGGTTPERQRLYKQGHWQELVQSIYARDGFHCRRCGTPKTERKGLHAHHIRDWARHPELRFDPDNLVTLCHRCHLWVHSSQNSNREYLSAPLATDALPRRA